MEQLDLHGNNRYEAPVLIQGFLKENYYKKSYFVCIIPGFGNNIMQQIVRYELSINKYVKSYELAPPQYGGAGAIIVYLKDKVNE